MFCWGISLSTNTTVIGLTSLLFNKTVNGFNNIVKKTAPSFAVKFIKLYYIVQKKSLFESRIVFFLFTLYMLVYYIPNITQYELLEKSYKKYLLCFVNIFLNCFSYYRLFQSSTLTFEAINYYEYLQFYSNNLLDIRYNISTNMFFVRFNDLK